MLTIAYLTFRLHPRFEWFCASLARELRSTNTDATAVQVIVIDGRLWYEGDHRRLGMLDACGNRFRFEHYAPKPSIWQGPTRLTSRDFFCAASVRNTALCYARGTHVAFVDDLSVLLPGWLMKHQQAMVSGYVLAGTTCKNKNIIVDTDGSIRNFDTFPPGQDSRIGRLYEDPQPINGDWLYGGTFSVPLERALQVNGQDEQCDTIGGEDYDFGVRLARTGVRMYITRNGTYEDEDGHHAEAPMVRVDKPWPGQDGPYSSNYLLKRLTSEAGRTAPLGNVFDLRTLRDRVLAGEGFPVPTGPDTHWVDGQPLKEI